MAEVNLRNLHPGLTIDGVTKSYSKWSTETGLSRSVVWTRVNVLGWTDRNRILSTENLSNTPEINKSMSINRIGKNNPAWKGGVTPQQKKDYAQKWRKDNESHVRDKEYRKRFGITLEEYDVLLNIQNGVCAICGNKCNRGRLAVDHCHKTGRIRGLLCRKCNAILGLMNDDLNWLNNAHKYLCHSDQA